MTAYHVRYRGLPGADMKRMERFIEAYEPHVVADDAMLRQVLAGHPAVCPIYSMAARIAMGRN